MGLQVVITFLILNVGGFLVLGSADQGVSPAATPTSYDRKRHGGFVAAPPLIKTFHNSPSTYRSSTEAPIHHSYLRPSQIHPDRWIPGSAPSPSIPIHKFHHGRKKFGHFAPEPSNQLHPPTYIQQVPLISPRPSSRGWGVASPAPSPAYPSSQFGKIPVSSPIISPASSSLRKKSFPPPPVWVLPPPPPNEDCTSVTCTQPLTYTPAGSPCACVWPIEVRLSLSISPYTFFPLVSEFAKEIATSISLNVSQARIMGANAAGEQLEKTVVLVNLVPMKDNFNPTTVFDIYRKFWKKQVFVNASRFGTYEVLYVRYPGLPPSPPSLPSDTAVIVDQPFSGNDRKPKPFKPIGVDVPRRRQNKTNGSMIAVVVLSSVAAFVVCMGVLWLLLLKCGICTKNSHPEKTTPAVTSSYGKSLGAAGSLTIGSKPSSASLSFSSSLTAYTRTAKIFSMSDIEKATENFNTQNILGEGGFGVVYNGVLEDGTKAAVKVLKRDDQQGTREFLAEVEMLSRLHHRNLVKLLGICTEERLRCLVYELVPNGSVESHLHGVDKEVAPLDWCARMKIALGAARGLAYLHEDSNPRVIHRDFKSSNILLENDFTPKVSDFGLARTALDEEHRHISTHVMGTFGYLAPEYAMTGHLLVKSDVYSYGVVLLELLTGRKPVDLLQPPGQENLVTWARPLLTNKEGLELLIDPTIKSKIPLDSIVKVTAIASMCVQPEVSHRPFMGEVVQALKLVCNEFEEIKESTSRSCSQDELDVDNKRSRDSGELLQEFHHSVLDSKVGFSAVDLKSAVQNLEGVESESFRRQFNSAPLRMGRRKQFWRRLRGLSGGSMSEHGFSMNS